MALRKVSVRCVLVAVGVLACGGAGGKGGGSTADSADPSSFDCAEYGTSQEFEGLEPETREHLRAMCEIEAEFEQFAAERRGCKTSADCTTVETSCPFGCAVAVATSSRADVTAKYEELSERFRAEGSDCKYECGDRDAAVCVDGSCRLEKE
jgi:hypothetical protein